MRQTGVGHLRDAARHRRRPTRDERARSWSGNVGADGDRAHGRECYPLVLSLSKDERPRSWFDKLTMSDATSSP